MNKTCQPEYRSLLAAVLLHDPLARQVFNKLVEKGAEDFTPGNFYFRNPGVNTLHSAVDPTSWTCKSYKTNRIYNILFGPGGWRGLEIERLNPRLP